MNVLQGIKFEVVTITHFLHLLIPPGTLLKYWKLGFELDLNWELELNEECIQLNYLKCLESW